MEDSSVRPNPDQLLKLLKKAGSDTGRARLRVFLGLSAGVGKTYAMLKAAHAQKNEGRRVVIGVVETHGRKETAALTENLPLIERRKIPYRGIELEEMDLDQILAQKPDVVLVDELAHSNAPGSRHAKRYQDVLEILEHGIDVYTTVNVQHLESRKDLVEKITGVSIRETVPDSILDRADQIEVIDIAPSELLKRLKEGKVYLGEKADRAAQNFFRLDSLTALREIALRFTAEKVDHDLQVFHETKTTRSPWQTNERLMVAVSHSPYSERLIRATRRIAYSLEAPWIAVHVDNGARLRDEDQNQLAKNLNLARELQADIVTTNDTDVAAALERIARQKNVTQIIVGRPTRRPFRDRINGGSLLERLVRESQAVDVHVLRHDERPSQTASWFPNLNFQTGFIPYWNTFWFWLGLAMLSGLSESWLGYQAVGFVFLLGVLVVGRLTTLGPVFFSAALSAVGWNFFFIPPRLTFAIRQPEDVILVITFFVVALITGTLTARLKQHETLLREREERANFLYEILKVITSSGEKNEYLGRVTDRLGEVLDARCGVLLKSEDGKLSGDRSHCYLVQLTENEMAVAQWAFRSKKRAGWSTDTLADTKTLFLPLEGKEETLGVLVFEPLQNRRLSTEQEHLILSVCRQLALSLERHFNQKRVAEADRLHDSEKLHQTLLNSISHEMRTPLTAILSAASTLNESAAAQVSSEARNALAAEITSAGQRLNRVVENLLDMSRLSAGGIALKPEWHDLRDLIGVAVSRLKHALTAHTIDIELADDLPLVQIDFKLMEHAVTNVVFNAISYTPKGSVISIRAEVKAEELALMIEDNGPGIPDASLPLIFEKFYRAPGTPAGGTGLGLSIVKNIVELHGGRIQVENRTGGGARFTLALPLGSPPQPPAELL